MFATRVVAAIKVSLSEVLDLGDRRTRRKLQVTLRDLRSTGDRRITQAIGIAARKAGLEGILYPVGNSPDRRNLAVLLERVTPADLTATVLEWPNSRSVEMSG